ncbi:MAG: hypothetical protein JO242_05295 [Streptosporangiaceae bacterium]|nr:hypothetical protein [Streptosporangiaceae bacterium]
MSGTEVAAQPTADAVRPPGTARRWWARARTPAGFTVAAVVLFTCYLRQSRTISVGSDGASNALQAWDMLHGNLLLHGWFVSDVSFYTTELPQYMLVEAIRGLGSDVIHVAGAMTYTRLVLLAALAAKGRARGREGAVRAVLAGGIMLAPQLGNGTSTLLLSPDHTGSAIPVLVLMLLLDRFSPGGWRPRWYVPVATGVLLVWGLVADQIVLLIGVIPLALVCAARAYQGLAVRREGLRSRWYDLSLAAAAVVSVPAASLATRLIRDHGGWVISPVPTGFASTAAMPKNFSLTFEGLLELFGADFFGEQTGRDAAFAFVHLAGLALAVLAIGLAVRHFLGRELIVGVLATAIVLNVAAYISSDQVSNILSTREIAPVLPFAAVLAGRLLAERVLAARLKYVMAGVLACYAGMLGFAAAQPAAPPQYADLAAWLSAHDLTSGVSGYSEANIVTLETGGTIQIRPVVANGPFIASRTWEANRSWYGPSAHSANFLAISSSAGFDVFEVTAQQASATFGPPAGVYRFGRYTVMVWNENLLTYLRLCLAVGALGDLVGHHAEALRIP